MQQAVISKVTLRYVSFEDSERLSRKFAQSTIVEDVKKTGNEFWKCLQEMETLTNDVGP